jgi:hypothetical protein
MEQQGGLSQPAQPPPPTDAATSRLDGLRAWLGTLDRMVEIRSLIRIVLAALAVGASAAAIYIALDSADSNDAGLSRLQTEIDELRRDAGDSRQDLGAASARIDSAQSAAEAAHAEADRLRAAIRGLKSAAGDAGANGSGNAPSGGASQAGGASQQGGSSP